MLDPNQDEVLQQALFLSRIESELNAQIIKQEFALSALKSENAVVKTKIEQDTDSIGQLTGSLDTLRSTLQEKLQVRNMLERSVTQSSHRMTRVHDETKVILGTLQTQQHNKLEQCKAAQTEAAQHRKRVQQVEDTLRGRVKDLLEEKEQVARAVEALGTWKCRTASSCSSSSSVLLSRLLFSAPLRTPSLPLRRNP